jgi:hypothetical protein
MNSIRNSILLLLPAMRISFALALLTTCVLLGAELLGFTPNEDQFLLDTRKKISESLAIQFSVFDPVQDIKKTQTLIRFIVKRNPNIRSAGIRPISGKLIYQSNNHEELWQGYDEKRPPARNGLSRKIPTRH